MDDPIPTSPKAIPSITAVDASTVVPDDSPVFPQELQDMVIEGLANSIQTLRAASLVNRAWRRQSWPHLFARIAVKAIARDERRRYVPGITEIPDAALPIITFKAAVATIPHCFDTILQTLVLRAVPLHIRMENTTRGARLAKAELCAHDILAFLERFPKLHSLVIEDAEWVDCPEATFAKCDCMDTVTKRPYKTLAFRRITHDSATSEDVTFITQSATSIENLVIENVSQVELPEEPYEIGPLTTLTLGISSDAWDRQQLIPTFPSHTLTSLNITDMSHLDTPIVQSIIEDHEHTLRNVALRARSFGDALGVQWDALKLDRCTSLQSIKIFIPIDFGSMVRIQARQSMLIRILAQVQDTVNTISLVFEVDTTDFVRHACLLSNRCWRALIATCRRLPGFTKLEIGIHRPPGTIPVQRKLKDNLYQNLSGMFSDATGNQIPFNITYGMRMPFDIDNYDPTYEEAWDEAFEVADETDLEED